MGKVMAAILIKIEWFWDTFYVRIGNIRTEKTPCFFKPNLVPLKSGSRTASEFLINQTNHLRNGKEKHNR